MPDIESLSSGKIIYAESLTDQLTPLRLDALAQLSQVLLGIPEFSDETTKKIDNLTKEKRPLDKAIANFDLIHYIWMNSPTLQEYVIKRKSYTENQQQRIIVYTSKPHYFGLVPAQQEKISGLYYTQAPIVFQNEELIHKPALEAWASNRDQIPQLKVLANLTLTNIGDALLNFLEYDPKKDDAVIFSRLKDKKIAHGHMSFVEFDDQGQPYTVILRIVEDEESLDLKPRPRNSPALAVTKLFDF